MAKAKKDGGEKADAKAEAKAEETKRESASSPGAEGNDGTAGTISSGDIVYLDFDAFSVGNGDLIDTTHREKAEAAGMYDPDGRYGPRAIIAGKGEPVPGLDEDIQKAEVGKERTVEVSPAKAYGERNGKLVEIHPKNELLRLPEYRRDGHYNEPEVGDKVTIRGRTGYVTTVTGGRVRIDFNKPLAGRTMRYVYTVTKKATTAEDRVRAVIDLHYGSSDDFSVEMHGEKEARIQLTDKAKIDPAWQDKKLRMVADLRSLGGLTKFQFVEEYVKREVSAAVAEAVAAAEGATLAKHDHEHDHKHEHADHAHPAPS